MTAEDLRTADTDFFLGARGSRQWSPSGRDRVRHKA